MTLLKGDKKHWLEVAHRRFGKDFEFFTLAWCEAVMTKGIYIYFLPTISQSRHVIWETIGEEGISLLERIPKQFVEKINHSDQKVKFINGSVLYVSGSDNYKRWIGMNARCIYFSEYQDSVPAAMRALSPMVTRNKGSWRINGTPRAFSHFKEQYDLVEKNPQWLVRNLTADDTYEEDGSPIITLEMIDEERRNGMPEELIQQEYYGSWDAAIIGSYYGKIIGKLRETGRIDESYTYNPNFPVYTGWDLGYSDHTTIWFAQAQPHLGLVAFDYYENRQQDISFYAEVMRQKRKFWGWDQSREINFGPHDVANSSVGAGNLLKLARENGLIFIVAERPKHKIHGIHLVRHKLPQFCFNSKNCAQGLKHLVNYRSEYDLKNNVLSMQPVHDAASHGADGMQTLVIGYMYKYEPHLYRKQIEYANLYGMTA